MIEPHALSCGYGEPQKPVVFPVCFQINRWGNRTLSHVLILHDEASGHIGKTGVTDLCDLNTFGDFKPQSSIQRPVIK